MIDLSGSELFAASTKALLGAGADRALAEEGANAALWLHAKGYNGTRALVSAATDSTEVPTLGVTAVDLLASGTDSSTSVEAIESALLLVGLLGVASSQYGLRFTVSCEQAAAPVLITPTTISGPVDAVAAPLTIECERTSKDQPRDHARALRLSLSDADWEHVNAAAARIYVPSNEHSRATGAGAGLVDAD